MAAKKKAPRYGLIDPTGTWAFEPKFEELGRYAEDRIAFRVDKKWGYADTSGAVVIEPAFDFAYNFAGGTASVEVDGAFISIDHQGAPVEHWSADPSDGRILMAIHGRSTRTAHKPPAGEVRFGYWDLDGNEVVAPTYVDAYSYTEGRAKVKLGDGTWDGPPRYQFIDHAGEVAVPEFRAWDARAFSHGVARYRTPEHRWRFIDLDGKLVVDTNALECGRLVEDRISVRADEKDPRMARDVWGYIDGSGKVIVEPIYVGAGDFSNGRALVRHYTGPAPTYGFIDLAGELVIDNQFRNAYDFAPGEGGTAPVSIVHPQYYSSSLWGLIDREGNYVIEPCFALLHRFTRGYAWFERPDGSCGLVSATGEIVADGCQALLWRGSFPVPFNRGGKRKANGSISGGKWGFLNRDGSEAVACTLHAVGTGFSHGYAAVATKVAIDG